MFIILVLCVSFTKGEDIDVPYISHEDYLGLRFRGIEFIKIETTPYNVLVFGENNRYFCTGTLISLEWIITAAHCMFSNGGKLSENDGSVVIVAGVNSLNETNKYFTSKEEEVAFSPGRSLFQVRQSVRLVVCYLYNFNIPFMHDLALIKVRSPFDESPFTKPIALPTSALSAEGNEIADCDCPSFGKIMHFQDSKHDSKLKTQRYGLSKICSCFDLFEPQGLLLQNTWYCPEAMDYVGLCDGDNGAPLVCDGVLRGVSTNVMFFEDRLTCQNWPEGEFWPRKNDCGDPNNLNVFTDLCVYARWIHSHVPSYPVLDPTTCVLRFPWTEGDADFFNPKENTNTSLG